MAFEGLDLILKKYEFKHESLIAMMQDLQRSENYLSREALNYISEKLEIPLSRIYHIATFYKSFSLKPRGKHIIKVCVGTTCHLNGAVQNVEQVKRTLNVEEGETTSDMVFSLETVNCVGTCARAPVTVVDDTYFDAVTPGKVERILSKYSKVPGDNEGENT